jgi:dUTP pyrophosphatase
MEPRPALRILKKDPQARLPEYATAGAAGADLRARLGADMVVIPGERVKIPTGLVLEIPEGCEGQVRPRSGLAARKGLTVLNAPGTIDSDYRGELEVLLINLGAESVTIRDGDRIAQLVIAPVIRPDLVEVQSVSATPRGAGGFGSTGS